MKNRKGAILMKNRKKIGLIGGIAALAVILCIAAVVILTRNGGSAAYRDISVFDLSASATVTRDGTTLDAYSGMKLMNGDNVKVGDEGNMCLLLDDDKYVTLETGTEIRLNASGSKEDSKTRIELVQGAVLNELDSKLNNDSSYELSTPVSVMAVRGTVFRVSLDSDGEKTAADVMVFDGKVAAAAVLADGTVSSKENMVAAGEAADFHKADAGSDPVYAPKDIDFTALPADTLKALLKIYDSGRISDLSVSKDDLQQIIKEKESADDTVRNEDGANTADPASGTDSSDADNTSSGASGSDTDADSSGDDNAAPGPSADGDDGTSYGSGSSGSSSDSDSSNGTVSNPDSKSGKNSGSASDKKSGKKSGKKSDAKSNKNSDKKTNSNKKPNSAKTPVPVPQQTTDPVINTPATPAPGNTTYTVTFIDPLGRVFGTQSIAAGSRAQKPVLSPAGGTNWCDAGGNVFNFDTAITGDLTLYYR